MLWIKALHIIAMVAWFAGLFYLPRLFVYHATAQDLISLERFKIMERRLWYGITCPAGIITTGLGVYLLAYNFEYYYHAHWMHFKVFLGILLWLFHGYCGYCVKQFAVERNRHTAVFFRFFNEIPTLILIGMVVMVVVRPNL